MERDSYIDGIPGTEELVDVHDILHNEHKKNSQIVLIPPPSKCGSDPLTWPKWKKYWQLFLVALYACAFSFGENTLGAAWTTVSEDIDVSITNMNGGSALNYLLLGFVNIFWIPSAMKVGRRPVFLLSTLFVVGAAIWIARCHGVASWMLSMSLNGCGTSAYQAVIQLSVMDMFFVHERGRMITVYLFGQQLGSVIGLVSGGKIADSIGWQWSQYLVAIINFVVFLMMFFTFEETLFPRFLFGNGVSAAEGSSSSTNKLEAEKLQATIEVNSLQSSTSNLFPKRTYAQQLKLFVHFPQDHTTFWQYFRRPFFLFRFPNILFGGFLFALGCTAGIVTFNTISEILTEDPYGFSTTATGLICLGAFVGNIIGWITGALSDYVVLYCSRRNDGVKEPEMRLWTLVLTFIYGGAGYLMYGWGAQKGAHWIVICIGLCLMIAEQVSACAIATSYCMDCYRGITGELVTVLALFSSVLNFAFSYSIQPFINTTGYGWAFFFFCMIVLLSISLAIPVGIYGKKWRRDCAEKYYKFVSEGKDNEAVDLAT